MAPSEPQTANWRAQALDWAKTIAGAFLAYVTFTTLAFANYRIPSESMAPHLEVGDYVAVSKFSYGYGRYSLPFNIGAMLPRSERRLFEHLPERGDVVVFINPVSGETMIKRAIGLPGDVVEVHGGAVYINGEPLETSAPQAVLRRVRPEGDREWAQRYDETLPGGVTHSVYNLTNSGMLDEFGPYQVPDGHIFFMGDNRDNSADSRTREMGPVPIENLIGRAEIVYATAICNDDRDASCPMPRWMRPLHH
jgi:signal peptidase I